MVAFNNINNDDHTPLIVEKNNSSGAEAEDRLLSVPNNTRIPILLENCNETQDKDPIKTEKVEKR